MSRVWFSTIIEFNLCPNRWVLSFDHIYKHPIHTKHASVFYTRRRPSQCHRVMIIRSMFYKGAVLMHAYWCGPTIKAKSDLIRLFYYLTARAQANKSFDSVLNIENMQCPHRISTNHGYMWFIIFALWLNVSRARTIWVKIIGPDVSWSQCPDMHDE